MNIVISRLRERDRFNDFLYNQLAERENQIMLSPLFNCFVGHQTQGNTATYDYMLGRYKVEQKIKSDREVQIHYYNDNYMPVGLKLSESDLFLIISIGSTNKIKGGLSLKFRLYSTAHLKTKMVNDGSKFFILDNKHKDIKHIYLGEVPFHNLGTEYMGYYTENFIPYHIYVNNFKKLEYDIYTILGV